MNTDEILAKTDRFVTSCKQGEGNLCTIRVEGGIENGSERKTI